MKHTTSTTIVAVFLTLTWGALAPSGCSCTGEDTTVAPELLDAASAEEDEHALATLRESLHAVDPEAVVTEDEVAYQVGVATEEGVVTETAVATEDAAAVIDTVTTEEGTVVVGEAAEFTPEDEGGEQEAASEDVGENSDDR